MAKIKASTLTQPTRTITCKVVVPNDEGVGSHEEDIRVVYFSPSIQWWRDHGNTDESEKRDLGLVLSEMIAELPDVLGDDDKPVAVTVKLLRAFNTENLNRINRAIGEDMDPEKKSPPKSLPSSSRRKAPKAKE